MRTQSELVERFKKRSPEDFFGFEVHEYLNGITKETAETLRGDVLKDDCDLSDWTTPLDSDEAILKEMKDYMGFAYMKAQDERGISANRSISHYIAWLWMYGEDGFDDLMDEYEGYGIPQLERICNFLGIKLEEQKYYPNA